MKTLFFSSSKNVEVVQYALLLLLIIEPIVVNVF